MAARCNSLPWLDDILDGLVYQEIIQKNTSITSFIMPDKLEVVMEKYLYDSVVEELNIKYPDKLYETSYKIVSDVLYEIIPVNESNARLIIKNYCEF